MWMQQQWLLAYAHNLQHVAEATTSHWWLNEVKAFMYMTKVQHPAASVMCCWGDRLPQVPYQHDGGEYTRVITLINKFACRLPSKNAFDELVYPPKALQHKGESFKLAIGR